MSKTKLLFSLAFLGLTFGTNLPIQAQGQCGSSSKGVNCSKNKRTLKTNFKHPMHNVYTNNLKSHDMQYAQRTNHNNENSVSDTVKHSFASSDIPQVNDKNIIHNNITITNETQNTTSLDENSKIINDKCNIEQHGNKENEVMDCDTFSRQVAEKEAYSVTNNIQATTMVQKYDQLSLKTLGTLQTMIESEKELDDFLVDPMQNMSKLLYVAQVYLNNPKAFIEKISMTGASKDKITQFENAIREASIMFASSEMIINNVLYHDNSLHQLLTQQLLQNPEIKQEQVIGNVTKIVDNMVSETYKYFNTKCIEYKLTQNENEISRQNGDEIGNSIESQAIEMNTNVTRSTQTDSGINAASSQKEVNTQNQVNVDTTKSIHESIQMTNNLQIQEDMSADVNTQDVTQQNVSDDSVNSAEIEQNSSNVGFATHYSMPNNTVNSNMIVA